LSIVGGLIVFRYVRRSAISSQYDRLAWLGLGSGLCLLSVAKVFEIHHVLGDVVHISWVDLALPVIVALSFAYMPFLMHLPGSTRNAFIVSGIVYLAGSIVVDLLTGPGDACADPTVTFGHTLANALEGGLEMSGLVMLISAVLRLGAPNSN